MTQLSRPLTPPLIPVLRVVTKLVPVALARVDPSASWPRELLHGETLTRSTESGTLHDWFDRRLHTCSDGRSIYDTACLMPADVAAEH